MKQSIRDVVAGELSLEYFAKRIGEGWRVASIEWVREASEAEIPAESLSPVSERLSLPYGFRIAGTGVVEENPLEMAVLLIILDQVVRERRIQEIARELNQRGYSTREGAVWSAAEVFDLMPRLIEAGPSLLKSAAWQQLRNTLGTSQRPN